MALSEGEKMPYENIIYEKTEKIAMITLNRPERLNALDRLMAEELLDALTDCQQDERMRVLLITGAGRAFCAGGDVKAMKESLDKASGNFLQKLLQVLNQVILAIRSMPKPVVAIVNGHAVGAGFNLALACDLCIASADAKFRQAFASLGLVPDTGGTYLLPRLVGLHRAAQLAFLDEVLTAQEAQVWGLINRVAPAETLMEEAWAWAEKLADAPTPALGRAKTLMQQGLSNDLVRQLQQELAAQVEGSKTADHREGLVAFLEKRKPDFAGK